MKLKYLHLIFIFLLLSLNKVSFAQEVNKSEEIEIYTSSFSEEITLFTDRTIYSVGEDIFFKASYFSDVKTKRNFSTVLYVELIEPDGSAFVQLKFAIDSNSVVGSVLIPHNLLSGNYYIKAYTKWMRNFPPETYGYQQIKVINPNNSDFNQNVNKQVDVQEYAQIGEMENLVLLFDKAEYKTGEQVNLTLKLNQGVESDNTYCISVVKYGAKNLSESWITPDVKSAETNKSAHFYPEIDGISISGKIVNPENKELVSDALVSVALLGNTSYYSANKTNAGGEFFASFPKTIEEHDFFINAEKEDMNLTIEIDNDFCNKPVKLFNPEFNLTEQERIIASEICVNAQIMQAYHENNDSVFSDKNSAGKFSFYGAAERVLYTKDYINVPKLRDFIFELMREVKFEKNKLVPSFISGKTNTLRSSPYLVLVDNVPISDEQDFMNISTNKIERIELINKGYIVGNNSYCGIISVFSKNNDMAGIDLPENGMFFKYQLLNKQNVKEIESKLNFNSRYPDRRNCLYWNPDIKIVSGEENKFSFLTSDVPGKYEILIQAIAKKSGEPVVCKKTIVVD